MGSLSASIKYERESHRLPPLDQDHLSLMERRRVAASAAMLHSSTTRLMSAGAVAQRQADRRAAELNAWKMMEEQCGERLREARLAFARTPTKGSLRARSAKSISPLEANEQKLKEAMRETARDCVRRDELQRRLERAKSASDLAHFRRAALEMEKEEEKRQLELKQKKEAERVEAKLAVEAGRLSRSVSFGHLREEERQRLQEQEEAKNAKLREERANRANAREEQKRLKQEKLQREEEARELANERRRKEKAQANLALIAVKAHDLATKAEACWRAAVAAEAKAASDVEAEENRLQILQASGLVAGAPLDTLYRLQRRLEMSRQRAESAGRVFRANAYWATHPDQPRPSPDEPLPEDE